MAGPQSITLATMKKRSTRIVLTVIAIPALFLLLPFLDRKGYLCFRYPSVYENEPLNRPCRVTEVLEGGLVLEDGRFLKWNRTVNGVADWLEGSEYMVELEATSSDQGSFTVHHRFEWGVCGTPYAALIRVPLIPHRIPRYGRRILGWGRVTAPKEEGGQQNSGSDPRPSGGTP